jgi:hypothetical protein
MAGVKGRSGRKAVTFQNVALGEGEGPPELREDLDSVTEVERWVVQAVAATKIDPVHAREMTAACRVVVQVIRERRAATQLEEMRDIERRLEVRKQYVDTIVSILHKRGIDVAALLNEAKAMAEAGPRPEGVEQQ